MKFDERNEQRHLNESDGPNTKKRYHDGVTA